MYVQNVLDQFELKLIQILLQPEKKRTVVWPSVGMIITSNGRSQQTPSTTGGKGKIQRLHDCMVVDPYKARKRYTVTESLDLIVSVKKRN